MITYTPDDRDDLLDSIYYEMFPTTYTGSFSFNVTENPDDVFFTEWFADDYTFKATLYSKTNENEWLTVTYPEQPQTFLR